jgi:ATP-dependent Lon protease
MDPVPAALRDRMEVIELPGYIEEEKVEIAKRFLVPRQCEQNGIDGIEFTLPEETLRVLAHSYTREAGVRNLEREISGVCRKIARRVAEEELTGPVTVRPEDLSDLLGPVRFEPEIAERAGQPGVAVGLAWTPAGGDILFVESTRMPGKGELKLTGSLGDVMRESAEAARSWLRGRAGEFGLDTEIFEKSDLHVHVPAHGDVARVAAHGPARPSDGGDDRGDHPAWQGASRRWYQGEDPRGEARGDRAGGGPRAQPARRRGGVGGAARGAGSRVRGGDR